MLSFVGENNDKRDRTGRVGLHLDLLLIFPTAVSYTAHTRLLKEIYKYLQAEKEVDTKHVVRDEPPVCVQR